MDFGTMLNPLSPDARASRAAASEGSASETPGRFPGEGESSDSAWWQDASSRVSLPVMMIISKDQSFSAWLIAKRSGAEDPGTGESARVPVRIALDDQDSFERAKELVSEWNEDGTRTPLNARLLKTGIESVLGEGYTAALTAATVSGRTEATDAGPAQHNAQALTFHRLPWLGWDSYTACHRASVDLENVLQGGRWRNSSTLPIDQPVTQTLTLHFAPTDPNVHPLDEQVTVRAAVCKTVQDFEEARQHITSMSNPVVPRGASSTISRQADPGVGSSSQGGVQHANDYVQAEPQQREPQLAQPSQRSAPTSMGYNTFANPNAGFVTPSRSMQVNPGIGSSRQGHLQYGSDYAQPHGQQQQPQFLHSWQRSAPTSMGYNTLANTNAGFVTPSRSMQFDPGVGSLRQGHLQHRSDFAQAQPPQQEPKFLQSSQQSAPTSTGRLRLLGHRDTALLLNKMTDGTRTSKWFVSQDCLSGSMTSRASIQVELVDQQSLNAANQTLLQWRDSQPRGGRTLIDEWLIQNSIRSVLGDDPAIRSSHMTGQTQREIRGAIEEAQYQSDPSAFTKAFQFRPFYAALNQAASDLNDFIGSGPSANDNAARQFLTLHYDGRPDTHLTVNVDVCTTSEQLAHAAREVVGEAVANQGGGSAGSRFMDVVME
ncbi:hypothetical protein JCM24511_02258 [Saitozyma sp. JCM 24511]|nr:hypothetical protein JCM24511_02258 [Saitozyma sp. JCM 24511]